MTAFEQPGKSANQPFGSQPSSAPARTPQTMGEATLNSLPILTEFAKVSSVPLPHDINADEMQQLLRQLESHIEMLFTQKLALHLEQIQRQAIDLALDELKAELPALVRDAMHAYLESR